MSDGMADWEVISKQTDRSRSSSLRAVLLSLLLLIFRLRWSVCCGSRCSART